MNYPTGEKVELMDEVEAAMGTKFHGFVVGFDRVNGRTFAQIRIEGTEGEDGKIWATENTLTLIKK